ncbi:MAG TPA: lyase family protein, partial [Aliarcobacter cryaerophilus]|nr:lyase family protein [Aliarcobacter cryaerophilus]
MPNTNNQILKNTNSKLLDMFNASIMFDKKLYSQDIKGSIAHSKMLALQNIITNDEQKSIEKGLLQVLEEIKSGEFEFSLEYEDIHMAVENRLTQIIGEAGKKVHTARSRNDQVCTDFTLYVQEKTKSIQNQIKELISTFVEIASKHTTTIMPGMTHLQHAQPINFGFHMM